MSYRHFLSYSPVTKESDKENGFAPGYYLVRKSDSERFFISKVVDVIALEKVAEEVLDDKTGYEYWIDYSLGKTVDGRAAWVNVDQIERFF